MTGDSANFADALLSGRFSTAWLWIGPSLDRRTPKSEVTAFFWCNSLVSTQSFSLKHQKCHSLSQLHLFSVKVYILKTLKDFCDGVWLDGSKSIFPSSTFRQALRRGTAKSNSLFQNDSSATATVANGMRNNIEWGGPPYSLELDLVDSKLQLTLDIKQSKDRHCIEKMHSQIKFHISKR